MKGQNHRTNFNNATPQIIGIDVREAVHARMSHELEILKAYNNDNTSTNGEDDNLQLSDLNKRYHIALSERHKIFLPDLLTQNQADPAFRVIIHVFSFVLAKVLLCS